MATYNNSIMTADGLILLADILAGGELEFVSLATGSGTYTSEEKKNSFIRTMKNLKEEQQTVPFSAIARMDNNQILLKANVANDELDNGYSMTEIGVFARKRGTDDLILYCVVTAEECDYFPSHSEGQYNIVFSIKTKIDDVENVSIVFSQETYALAEDLSEHINNMQNPHNVTKEQLEIEKIDNTADADKPVSTLQRAAIDEAYQQSNLYTDTKINELVNGAPATLDTLKEVADAIAENEDVVKALDAAIGERAKQSELDTHTGNNTIHVTADERSKWNKQSDDISALNNDLAKYLPLSGGTMTGSIAGNNGGYFATDGNVYSPLWGGWLHNKLNQFLDVTGSDIIINPVSDVNNFDTGIALFYNVSNLPPGNDWFLIISGGGDGTNVQVAYALGNLVGGCYRRNRASNTWTNWVRTDDPCKVNYWNGAGALFPYGNIAVFRCYDDTGYASIQASAFTQLSSKYAKDNVEDITDEEADKVLNLRTVTFDYKNGQKNQVGFIAEEVLKILPNCVFLPDGYVEDANAHESKLPSIDYSKFVPYIVKEIQVLNDRITKLEENK